MKEIWHSCILIYLTYLVVLTFEFLLLRLAVIISCFKSLDYRFLIMCLLLVLYALNIVHFNIFYNRILNLLLMIIRVGMYIISTTMFQMIFLI